MPTDTQVRSGAVFAMTLSVVLAACAATHEQALDVHEFGSADRSEARTSHDFPVATIRDPQLIALAAKFIAERRDGWSTPWAGAPIAPLALEFYQGSRRLGGYGIASDFLTSDPRTLAFLSRRASSDEIAQLLRQLGLHLPN